MILGLCTSTWILSMFDFMHQEHYVVKKLGIYVLFFVLAFIPSFHLTIYSRLDLLGKHFHLHDSETYLLLIIVNLTIGILFYGSRFPERSYPKKFDIFVSLPQSSRSTATPSGTSLSSHPSLPCTSMR